MEGGLEWRRGFNSRVRNRREDRLGLARGVNSFLGFFELSFLFRLGDGGF